MPRLTAARLDPDSARGELEDLVVRDGELGILVASERRLEANPVSTGVARPAWPRSWVTGVTLALEASVLVALVAIVASGALAAEPPPTVLPIPLGLEDTPSLAAIGAYVLLRDRWSRGARWSRRVPAFVIACAVTMGAAVATHPPDGMGAPHALLAGALTGLIFGSLGMPLHRLATDLEAGEPRPWRELHVACTLVALGSRGASARGGAIVAAPTIGAGFSLLLRGLRYDASAVRGAPRGAAAAALRVLLGLAFAALGVALLVLTVGLSLGLVRLPLFDE
jgi:hypothetical protein